MSKTNDSNGCITLLVWLVMSLTIGGYSVRYVIAAWAPLLLHHAVVVPFWPSVAVGIFTGPFFFPAMIITWLLKIYGAL